MDGVSPCGFAGMMQERGGGGGGGGGGRAGQSATERRRVLQICDTNQLSFRSFNVIRAFPKSLPTAETTFPSFFNSFFFDTGVYKLVDNSTHSIHRPGLKLPPPLYRKRSGKKKTLSPLHNQHYHHHHRHRH
ncbi:hypothetical protein IF1G_09750 [Cordyceps javanica]|uniref:Uncharacterized protein n=1 Tax=Cordyceps javanica TaxID=43265 RepID=A0A545UQD6_9HYPO|nr:hypothetical protein IF1G_09750 [Cordyceps javanica]